MRIGNEEFLKATHLDIFSLISCTTEPLRRVGAA